MNSQNITHHGVDFYFTDIENMCKLESSLKVTRICKSKKNTQHEGQKQKDKQRSTKHEDTYSRYNVCSQTYPNKIKIMIWFCPSPLLKQYNDTHFVDEFQDILILVYTSALKHILIKQWYDFVQPPLLSICHKFFKIIHY